MPVFTSSNMSVVDGNVVEIRADISPPDPLVIQPGNFVDIPETPLGVRRGIFSVSVGSLDQDYPSFRESGRTSFNTVPLKVEVFKAGDPNPVRTEETMSGPSLAPDPEHPSRSYLTKFDIDAGPANEQTRYSRTDWFIRLTNISDKVAQVGYDIRYVRDSSLISEDAIPLAVLNNTFAILLHALAPQATLSGKRLTVGISPEIAEYISALPEDGQKVFDLSDELPVGARTQLTSLSVVLVSGADALREVYEMWAAADARLSQTLTSAGGTDWQIRQLINANNKWRDSWHEKIDPTDLAVRFCVALTDVEAVLGRIWTEEISLGEIADARARIFMIFKPDTAFLSDQFGRGHALVFTPAHYEGVILGIADALGLAPDLGEKIEGFVNDAIPTIHGYFAEILVRLVHDRYTKRFVGARIADDKVFVAFCDDPGDEGAFPRFPPAPEPADEDAGTSTGGGASSGGGTIRLPEGWRGVLIDDGRVAEGTVVGVEMGETAPEPVGVVPDGFDLGSDESVARLDQVQTMVVVMMENRSFDHMLGRLSRIHPDRGYRCYPDDATNVVPGQSPIKMIPARDIARDKTHYAISVDPYHGTDHVTTQVNGGLMDGFSKDIMTKPDAIDRKPQVPLTYYDEQDIPFFYRLADEFMVCDRWFAAHPGGTYPNRWAFLSGEMPHTKNFHPDDPQMGFIKTRTIFDYLNNAGVEWVYYESNLGMLRMYDRYRLDNERVLPYGVKGENFEARAMAGQLPPVVFIEPKITGIPPLEQASDDHPPANILRGQEFLENLVRILRASPQWSTAMLVITYDEHGGFYDHEPPPGTARGGSEWLIPDPDDPTRTTGKLAKLHPNGARHLGPRVPTFIVSPFVEPGSVSHVVFDHTAVLKSILVRHRAKFQRNIIAMFGERVAKMSHLGEALNKPVPDGLEVATMVAPMRKPRTIENFGDSPTPPVTLRSLPIEAREGRDEVAYGFTLARAMMPKLPGRPGSQ